MELEGRPLGLASKGQQVQNWDLSTLVVTVDWSITRWFTFRFGLKKSLRLDRKFPRTPNVWYNTTD